MPRFTGQLVEKFQTFATPGAFDPSSVDLDTLEERMGDFESEINRLSLFMTALFIVRFGCNYINKVRSARCTSCLPSSHPLFSV